MHSIEPAFLDHLPERFRRRFRENLIALGFLLALFVIPSHVGRYGISAFFTIIWLGVATIFAFRLRTADPRPARRVIVLTAAMTALFAYPIVLTWLDQSNPVSLSDTLVITGALAFVVAVGLLWFLLIVYRTIFLQGLFGKSKMRPVSDFKEIRAAQTRANLDSAGDLEELKEELRRDRSN